MNRCNRNNLLLFWAAVSLFVSSSDAFQSFPLVPHHVQEQRQRQRRQLSEGASLNATKFVRRSRVSANDRQLRAQQVGALYQGYGTHYVDLWCGTPTPQRQTVIVDTGSAVTAFPCSGCRNQCGENYHIDQVFDETLSGSFETLECADCMRGTCRQNQCSIGMSYQEGSSWTAFEGRDYCYIGGPHGTPLPLTAGENDKGEEPADDVDTEGVSTTDVDPNLAASHAFPLVFGCQTRLTGLFKTQLADGIMGMDQASEAFWHQMSAAGKINEDIFTLCFARPPTAARDGTEAGAMTLGGIDARLHTSPLVYVTIRNANAFYGVHIRNVYLRQGGGGDSAASADPTLQVKRIDISESDLSRGTTIVDSGTTDTYFNRAIASAFNNMWKEMTGKSYNNNPVSLNDEQLHALPTILFQLEGLTDINQKLAGESSDPLVGLVGDLDPANPYDVLIAMPPSHYMEYDNDMKKYVPRFYTDEGSGSVLGANFMMGHNMVFDQVNGRLGVAESNCDYAGLVSNLGFNWDPHAEYNKVDHLEVPATDPPAEEAPATDPPADNEDTAPAENGDDATTEEENDDTETTEDDDAETTEEEQETAPEETPETENIPAEEPAATEPPAESEPEAAGPEPTDPPAEEAQAAVPEEATDPTSEEAQSSLPEEENNKENEAEQPAEVSGSESESASSQDSGGFCSSTGCKAAPILLVVAVVLVLVFRPRKKAWADGAIPVPYESELELQDADDGEFGGYSDEPTGKQY